MKDKTKLFIAIGLMLCAEGIVEFIAPMIGG